MKFLLQILLRKLTVIEVAMQFLIHRQFQNVCQGYIK